MDSLNINFILKRESIYNEIKKILSNFEKNKLESLGFTCTLDEVHYGSNLFMLYCKK